MSKRMMIATLLVGLVIGTAAVAAPLDARDGAVPSRLAQDAYLRAVRLHWQKDYAGAASLLEDVVGQFGRQCGSQSAPVARALLSLGWSRRELGDTKGAETAFRQSLAIEEARHGTTDGACVGALRALGMLYEADRRYEAAAEAYDRCVACLYEDDVHSLPTLAEVLERYAAVLRRLPRSSSWFGLADGAQRPGAEQLEARAKTIRARIARQSTSSGS